MSDEQAEAPAKRPLNLKLIIMVVGALVVLGGGGFGGWKFWKKRAAAKAAAAELAKAKAAEEEAAHPEGEAGPEGDSEDCEETGEKHESGGGEHGGGPAAAPVMVLTRTVNLVGPRRNAFLRCEFNILFCDMELGKLVSGDKPSPERSIIESIVLGSISGKSVEEASDPESREALRMEIKDKLNEHFKPHPPKPGEDEPKHKKPKRPIRSVLIVDWAIQQ